MKRMMLMVAMTALVSGCMTNGGLVIGPCSYLSAKSNEKAVAQRAMLKLGIEEPKKLQVFRAMRAGIRDNEVAAAVGVDVLSLMEAMQTENLTAGELAMQATTCTADAVIEAFTLDRTGVLQSFRDGLDTKSKSSTSPTVSVTGDGNNVLINYNGDQRPDQSVNNQ